MGEVVDGEIAVHRLLRQPVSGAPGVFDMPAAVLEKDQHAEGGRVALPIDVVQYDSHGGVEIGEESFVVAVPWVAMPKVPPAIFDLREFRGGADVYRFLIVMIGAEAVVAVGD